MDTRLVARLVDSPPTNVVSQIKINFSMVLNLLLSHSPNQIKDLLKNSFATYLIVKRRNPKHRPSDPFFYWHDFLRHLRFLKKKGFVADDSELTDDGRWASRLRMDQPLLVAEGLRRNLFPDSDPALLAAVFATFVSDRESDENINKRLLPKTLLAAFLSLEKGLRSFAKDMADNRFDVKPLSVRPAAAMFAWATGKPWDVVCSEFEIEEGDLAMLILRTADHLRHIISVTEAFTAVADSAKEAMRLILRDPVSTEYED
jgi:superfamily II RNA helicase